MHIFQCAEITTIPEGIKKLKHDKHLNTSGCLSPLYSSTAGVGISFKPMFAISWLGPLAESAELASE